MTLAALKSTAVANRDASPRMPSPAHLVRGPLFEAVGFIVTGADDDAGSAYRMARLRSSDRVSEIYIEGDGDYLPLMNLGIYRTADDGGAMVQDCLFDGQINLGNPEERTIVPLPDKVEKRLWELLGLSADPQVDYDVVLSPTEGVNHPVAISLRIRFTGGY